MGHASIATGATSHPALSRLGGRSIALVGLMGAGKTTVGRRLAQMLSLPFHDTDHEIEAASRMSIAELFAAYGEPEFRALETRVVARLAEAGEQIVIATGGGAFVNEATRAVLRRSAATVWLKADLETLMERVSRRADRPLLQTADPAATMRELMDRRYPIYALADITVCARAVRRDTVAGEIADALAAWRQGAGTGEGR